MRNFSHRWPQSRHFFLQIRSLFSNFRKRAGEAPPPLSPLVTCLHLYCNSNAITVLKCYIRYMLYLYINSISISAFKCYTLVVQRHIDRSSHRRLSVKKVFLQISQNSQENTCLRVSSLRGSKRLRCFPVNFP